MAERVLPENLNGLEIATAAASSLTTKLQKDCNLQETKSYGSFRFKCQWQMWAEDLGRIVENNGSSEISVGEPPEDHDKYLVEGEFEIGDAPPNAVRVETGQDVPVLTNDSDGNPTIKKIKYSRKQLEKASAR